MNKPTATQASLATFVAHLNFSDSSTWTHIQNGVLWRVVIIAQRKTDHIRKRISNPVKTLELIIINLN